MLRRAPHFLRAVRVKGSTDMKAWDALDQLEDRPKANEEIVVYEMNGEPTWMHIRARSGGGVYRGGQYRIVNPQPPDEILRSPAKWREWAAQEFAKRGLCETAS